MAREQLAAMNLANELEDAVLQLSRLHVDVSEASLLPSTRDEFLRHMGQVIERSTPFLHHPEMRASVVRMLLAFDFWESESQPHKQGTIHISPHGRDQDGI